MTRGGKREGAGRPKNEQATTIYYRRVKPEWVKVMDDKLNELKENDKNSP